MNNAMHAKQAMCDVIHETSVGLFPKRPLSPDRDDWLVRPELAC